MNALPPFPNIEVGMDLSKDKLDVSYAGKLTAVPNDSKGSLSNSAAEAQRMNRVLSPQL